MEKIFGKNLINPKRIEMYFKKHPLTEAKELDEAIRIVQKNDFMKPMPQEHTIREKWKEHRTKICSCRDNNFYKEKCSDCPTDTDVADWWLNEMSSHTQALREKIENLDTFDISNYEEGKKVNHDSYISKDAVLALLTDEMK